MISPKNWLCIITSDKEEENIDEMTRDIWTHFDGIMAVLHPQGGNDKVKKILEERKGLGKIIERPFVWHHAHSMNEWLFDRRIELMDACWIRDSAERFTPDFSISIRKYSMGLLQQNIWNLYYESKLFMFRRWFNQEFVNGLHWGLTGLHGGIANMDVPSSAPIPFGPYSVRNTKRPAYHRYRHEVLYLLDYGANGNHLQLFHPYNSDELDYAQNQLYHFMQYLHNKGIHGVDDLAAFFQRTPLNEDLVRWINNERPFRNFYRFYILNHSNEDILKDEDAWRLELPKS